MKQKWQQLDRELKTTKMLNEQIIMRMLTDKSASAVDKLKSVEYLGIGFCSLLLLTFLVNVQRVGSGAAMVMAYIITVASVIVTIAMSLYKLSCLSQIDFSSNTVTETAKKMQWFRLVIARERLWSVICSPVVILAPFIVVVKWIHHKDLLANPGPYLWHVVLAIVLLIAGTLLIYPKLYFSRINSIIQNLKEIELFRSEERS